MGDLDYVTEIRENCSELEKLLPKKEVSDYVAYKAKQFSEIQGLDNSRIQHAYRNCISYIETLLENPSDRHSC